MDTIFLFDLDSTITKQEILPTIAKKIGKEREMRELTEKTMMGDLPFSDSFTMRVKILSDIPVSEVATIVSNIEVNPAIIKFLQENHDQCYIVTNNLDVWIDEFLKKYDMSGRCFCSKAETIDDKLTGKIIINNKVDAFNQLTNKAKIVAIGDGSNDYNLIQKADIGISFGGVREISPALYDVSDYSIYNEDKLYDFLSIIAGKNTPTTTDRSIVISCAGMGTRLGAGKPKALIDIEGQPLIAHTLQYLPENSDIRIVVGYQAESVIKTVTAIRKDIIFVYNHNYKNNGTGASVSIAAKFGKKYILTIDGDVILHPDDIKSILNITHTFVGVCPKSTDDPVLTIVDNNQNVIGFSREKGTFEWTGITMLESKDMTYNEGHTYQIIEPLLPIPYKLIREKEIDTPNDYQNAIQWIANNFKEQ